ncbi:MAG: FliA/WhiG family RNA polymerase sigma factor [Defluviitaleaceae bacterium]|nr:FliA/WhiG family RNA polymerase sigma factor [Defluviitaleaceae bacterium]
MEDLELWQQYKDTKSPEVREKLILKYAPLVKYTAGRLAIHLGQHMDFDDLISYGIFGLIDAIDKFDMVKAVKFETYATVRIRGAIIDGIRSQDWVPRVLREKQKKLEQTAAKLESELTRKPTNEELADALKLSVDELHQLTNESSVHSLVSLDNYLTNYDIDFEAPYSPEDTPEGYSDNQEIKKMLEQAIEALNDREKLLVTLYYFEELPLKEISKILGVSESRTSQIHTRALTKMQDILGEYKYILFS